MTNAEDVSCMHPIEEAYDLLRKTENGVATPHAEGNPFAYLKKNGARIFSGSRFNC